MFDYITATDYTVAWSSYLLAAAILLAMQGWMTRRWHHETRYLLLALAAVLLLTPAPMPGHDVMAPAVGFLLLGGITDGPAVLAPVLVRLSIGGIVAILLVVAEGMWWRTRRRRRQADARAREQRRQQRQRIGV